MLTSGCRAFWGTCWNQLKLPVSAKPLCLHAWCCQTRCLSSEGPYCNDHSLWRVLSQWPRALSLPGLDAKLSFLLCFSPFASSQVLSLGFFWQKTLQKSGIFILAVPRRVCTEPASCLPTCVLFFFNQVMTNWLIQNLSRTKWWGRNWRCAAIIPHLSVVRPQNNGSFCNQASFPCF